MKKLLILLMLLGFDINGISLAMAEENEDINLINENTNEQVNNKAEQQSEENIEINDETSEISAKDISSEPEANVEYEKIVKVEREVTSLPLCDDEKLIKETSDYIKKYFDSIPNEGTIYRRRRYFILNNLDKFKEVNIEDYKTAETSPVSDIIADVKVNKGLVDENIRLCKNQSSDKYAGQIYALIYPAEDGYEVHLINLSIKQTVGKETSFIYKN